MTGHIAGVVHDHVPAPAALKRFQAVADPGVAIARQLLNPACKLSSAPAPVENCDLVSPLQHAVYLVGPDEAGAAEHKDFKRTGCPAGCPGGAHEARPRQAQRAHAKKCSA